MSSKYMGVDAAVEKANKLYLEIETLLIKARISEKECKVIMKKVAAYGNAEIDAEACCNQ